MNLCFVDFKSFRHFQNNWTFLRLSVRRVCSFDIWRSTDISSGFLNVNLCVHSINHMVFVSYALCKGIWSFHKFPPCWRAHVFPYRDPEFQFVKRLELYLNRVYHLLRLRIWCKIRVQTPQARIQSDIHHSCWNTKNCHVI